MTQTRPRIQRPAGPSRRIGAALLAALFALATPLTAWAVPTAWSKKRLPTWLLQDVLGIAVWQVLGIVLLIFFALFFQRIVVYFVGAWVRRLAEKVHKTLEAAVERAAQPLSGLMMALVFGVGFPLLGFSKSIDQAIGLAVRLLAVGSGVWLFYRQIDVISQLLAKKAEATETRLDDQLVPLVRRTLKAFAVVIGGIFILQNLSVDVASLVTGLGLGGLAFALAAKDTLANIFGSLVIFVDRPFQIGDWVNIEKIHGTVEDVGFRTTKIRTFYNSLVTVPNSKLTATMIDNYGAREYRRINVTLGLTYSTTPEQMQAFVEALRAMIAAHPETRKDYYEIHFNSFGAYSLDVMFYAFVKVPSWSDELKARHELFLQTLKIAQDLGVEFAFPTRTLHVDSVHQDAPRIVGGTKPHENDKLSKIVASYGPDGENAEIDFALTHGYFATTELDRGTTTEEEASTDSEGGVGV